MQEKDQERIEHYLAGDISEEERVILETRIAEDPVFREEVDYYKLCLTSLKLKKREELLERFKKRDQRPSKFNYLKLIFICLIILCGLMWILKNQRPNQKIIEGLTPLNDSTNINKDSIFHTDTSKIISPSNDNKTEKPIQLQANKIIPSSKISKEQPIAKGKISNEKLYALNFEPYKDETMNLNIRGNEALSAYDEFIKYYWNGNYKETLQSFGKLNEALQKNDNVLFIKANALMANGEIQEAKFLLEQLIKSANSRYIIEARWNLGLCYLKTNDLVQAKEQFEIVKKEVSSKDKNHISKLLRQF